MIRKVLQWGLRMKRLCQLALVAGSTAVLVWVGLMIPIWIGVSAGAEKVVLVHGLGRNEKAMLLLENRLTRAGYEVHPVDYPSLTEDPGELVRILGEQVESCCADSHRPVHFVAHSLGGLVSRSYLDANPLENLGKVVLIGTPSQGTELVDRFGDLWLFKAIMGPTAETLGTDGDSLPNRIGAPYYPLGIIAGNSSLNVLTKPWLKGPSDGVVPVESTKVKGMADFVEIKTSHGFLRYDRGVADQVMHFLEKGRFSRPVPASSSTDDG